MKRIIIAVVVLFAAACKKDDTTTPVTPATSSHLSDKARTLASTASVVNVQTMGAKGDGVTDDTQAIINAINYAASNNVPNVYFPDGTYLIGAAGNSSGIIALANGVGLEGNSSSTCHIKVSGGRYNPSALFYQAWWATPSINNIVIQGIDFDGQDFNDTYASSYQYGHALSINNGQNIEVKNCKFESFRGDGLLFGDTFESSKNLRITYNVSVHNNEFYNIFREATLFCCINGGTFYSNNVHGNGYLVGGVDIERHSVNETVENVAVYSNVFNFTDGYGPVERGGPSARYRRAVTMGFFYSGYTNATVDGLFGSLQVYNNTIYQGQIDCWGPINVSITGNTFTSTYENITGIGWLSAPAVNIADPANTTGLKNVAVSNNTINSTMLGNGIAFNHYYNVQANSNTISNTGTDAISIYNASGQFSSNIIQNVGTTTQPACGIVINGSSPSVVVASNKVTDTRSGSSRTVSYAVAMQSQNNSGVAPVIQYNTANNLVKGSVSDYYYQSGFASELGNTGN